MKIGVTRSRRFFFGRLGLLLCLISLTYSFQLAQVSLLPSASKSISVRIQTSFLARPSSEYHQIDGKTAIRGDRYFNANSTIPHASEVSDKLGVQPPIEASKKTWQRAWKLHKRALPLLHIFDKCKPPNSSLNLACIWWKAISGNDRSSPVYDDGLSFDLLPSKSRFVVNRIFRRFYPRLHHANVELRTAYLDKAVNDEVASVQCEGNVDKPMIRLISIGAGYDVRSIKFRLNEIVDSTYELDLPEVINTKQRLLERAKTRRKDLTDHLLPKQVGIDLNEVEEFREILVNILNSNDLNVNSESSPRSVHNIILFEAVLIYLNESVPTNLLKICSEVLTEYESLSSHCTSSLIFADRLENIPGGDLQIGREVLTNLGWEIVEWLPKPGLARHMGRLALITTINSSK